MRRVPVTEIGLSEIPESSRMRAWPCVLEPVDQLGRVLGALLELDPGVEVLGVLAHDDEVDVVVAGAHARVALARAHLARRGRAPCGARR